MVTTEEELRARVGRLEQQIARAMADLECYGQTPEGDRLARRDALEHLIAADVPRTVRF